MKCPSSYIAKPASDIVRREIDWYVYVEWAAKPLNSGPTSFRFRETWRLSITDS